MKKITLLCLLLSIIAMSANAQYKKGDIELEGEVSYTNIEGINSYKIAPEVNIFLSEHWAIEAGISLSGNDDCHFGISAGASYYLPIISKLYFAPSLKAEIIFGDENWAVGLQPKLIYELTEHLSTNLGIGYLGYGEINGANTFHFGITDQLSWGIAYKF